MRPDELLANPWATGPWCWCIDDVRLLGPLSQPKVRGMPGLWPLDEMRRNLLRLELGLEVRDALTVLEPFATAIAVRRKPVENREWRRNLPPEGRWIGLHAGTRFYDRAEHLLREWREGDRLLGREPIWPDAPTSLIGFRLDRLLGAFHVSEIVRYPDAE